MDDGSRKEIAQAIETHRKMLDELEAGGGEKISEAAKMVAESLKKGGCVYICGNGGSAADAQHIAGELVGRFMCERKGLAAIALTTDTSVMTAVANDYGYEQMFARQVEALVKDGDILWAISTSGSSANILAAADLAKNKGAKILAFTGRKNSRLEKLADVCLCADDKYSPHSQEMHQLAYHIICKLVEREFVKE